jgi:hypothetical protein
MRIIIYWRMAGVAACLGAAEEFLRSKSLFSN